MGEVRSESRSRRVRVLLGALDQVAFQEVGIILRNYAARPGTILEVDLSQTDGRHHLRLFALLSEATRAAHVSDNHVVALSPPDAMVTILTAVGVRVRRHAPDDVLPDEIIMAEDTPRPGRDASGGEPRQRLPLWAVTTRADPRPRRLAVPAPRSS